MVITAAACRLPNERRLFTRNGRSNLDLSTCASRVALQEYS